jgi:hypothetical protein
MFVATFLCILQVQAGGSSLWSSNSQSAQLQQQQSQQPVQGWSSPQSPQVSQPQQQLALDWGSMGPMLFAPPPGYQPPPTVPGQPQCMNATISTRVDALAASPDSLQTFWLGVQMSLSELDFPPVGQTSSYGIGGSAMSGSTLGMQQMLDSGPALAVLIKDSASQALTIMQCTKPCSGQGPWLTVQSLPQDSQPEQLLLYQTTLVVRMTNGHLYGQQQPQQDSFVRIFPGNEFYFSTSNSAFDVFIDATRMMTLNVKGSGGGGSQTRSLMSGASGWISAWLGTNYLYALLGSSASAPSAYSAPPNNYAAASINAPSQLTNSSGTGGTIYRCQLPCADGQMQPFIVVPSTTVQYVAVHGKFLAMVPGGRLWYVSE